MLLINGEYHPAFNEGSSNLNIRNGVGVLQLPHFAFLPNLNHYKHFFL